MANTKISALTAATTPVAGTEVLPIVQSNTTVKLAISDLTPGLSTITAVKGGTGQTSFAIGDILYASTTTALSKLADVATGNALISGGVNTAPSYGKIGLTTHVSGTLPVANGGTNLTSFTANGVMYASSTSALATGSSFVFDGTSVGIGTSSPTRKLDVATAGASYIRARNTTDSVNVDILAASTAGWIGTQTNHPFILQTNNTEAARCDINGNFITNTGYVKAAAYVWSAGAGTAGGYYFGSAGSANGHMSQASDGTGTVTTYIGNAAIATVSDVRLKENIVDTQKNATEILNQLRVVDHTWNDPSDQCENNRNSRGVWMGLIAQEAQPVIPWLVNKPLSDVDEEGNPQYWHMDYGYAVPLLIKAIQELSAKNDALEARLVLLEAK